MKTLRFGLLGLGYFGRNYVRLLQGISGVQLAAVSARTEETLSQFSSALPGAVLKTTDASLILENPDIDCVVIATPPSTHFAFAKKAIEHGKHVLVEKPMVASLEEAKKLKAVVSKSDATFMVGHQYVYNDYVHYLYSSIKNGSFGDVKCAVGEHLGFQVRQDIGCLWDAGPHQLSMLQYLLNPGKIVEITGGSVATSGSRFDGFASAGLRFESGLAATLVVSCFSPKKARNLTLVGSRKMAVFEDAAVTGKLQLFSKSSIKPESVVLNASEPLLNELQHFICCINRNEKPLTGIDSGVVVTEWLDRIFRSIRGQKHVTSRHNF